MLYLADCLVAMDCLDDQSFDAVICDPPYGTTDCAWDSVIPLDLMWDQLKRLIKPHGTIVLCCQQPFTSALVMSNPTWFKYEWVWDKVNAATGLQARHQPLRSHETVVIFGQGVGTYNPQMQPVAHRVDKPRLIPNGTAFGGDEVVRSYDNHGLAYPKSILTISNANQHGKQHSTQKPVALMEYLVRTYTNEGDAVLDFTMGSGTTGVACTALGRSFTGIERDPVYFADAQARIITVATLNSFSDAADEDDELIDVSAIIPAWLTSD